MINMPLSEIIKKISSKSGSSESEVELLIKQKVEQLYGLVSEEGAAHIIANELGIKLFDVSTELKIKDILIGMRSVDIVGRVLRKYELREFSTEKRKGKVANILLGDETGSIRVVFWNDKTDEFLQIKENDILKIKNAYVRDNIGRKELHLGDSSKILINPENVNINVRENIEYDKKHISELSEGMTAEILGTIVQVFDIKFFDDKNNPGKFNYVLNIYVDDGTGNIRSTLWRQQSQKLLNIDDNEILKFRDNPLGFEKFKTDLLGEQVKILGKVKNNITGRLELTVDLIYRNLNPDQELKMIEHTKEVILNTTQESKKENKEFDDEFEISEDFLD